MMKMKGLDDYKEINDAAVYSSSHRPSRNIRPRWHQDPRGGNHGHKKDHKSQFSCHSRRLESHCLSHVTSHVRVSHAFDRLRQRVDVHFIPDHFNPITSTCNESTPDDSTPFWLVGCG